MFATIPCPFCARLNRVALDRLDAGPKCGACARPLHLDRPIKVPGEAFDAVLSGTEVPVLVDFYADWCGPCRALAPVVDELAQAQAGQALVVKLDTDRSPGVSERFGIRGIPTLIAFRNGKETGRHVGLAQRSQLDALVTPR
ncbi:MAG TPA: thioredoxin [Gemmatimonadales bacterium]|nr:thioredoxin [Gemmatimonadales bacterium]